MSGVDVLGRAMFAAYSRNAGHAPDDHFGRMAAEQWMAQALDDCGVAELIEAFRDDLELAEYEVRFGGKETMDIERAKAVLARVSPPLTREQLAQGAESERRA